MDVKATFTRKMGPLPMWAWALLAGGGIGLYLRHRAAANAAQTTTTQAQAGTATADVTSPTSGAYASGVPGDMAYGGQYAGTTPADLVGAVEQGITQYMTDNPPSGVATGPSTTQPGPADGSGVGPAPIPIAVTIAGLPPEMQGGGPPAPTTRASQVRPRAPAAPVPPGTSPQRADTGVIRNGVDIGKLDAAMAITGRPGYPRVERNTMADRIRAHPDWGPYTLAHNGRVRGHSTRF